MAGNRGRSEFTLYTLVGIGAINVGSLLTGLLVGWLVDGQTGAFPVGTLVGLLVGIVTGLTASWLRIRDYFTQTHHAENPPTPQHPDADARNPNPDS
jgi:F0F1-type ATP synthase assembly protein I